MRDNRLIVMKISGKCVNWNQNSNQLPMYKIILFSLFAFSSFAQKTENVILISLDGFRWQEVFTGADSSLINDKEYTHHTEQISKAFWKDDANERRALLMPFMWKTIAQKGQIFGNSALGNDVIVKNGMFFSYPGYNEILTGYPDPNVDSNDKINNSNETVLEFVNKQKGFKGKVAAFGSWDVFPYIINEERSGVPVNAGFEAQHLTNSANKKLLNELQLQVPEIWGTVRFDAFTHQFAKEYLVTQSPKLLYIAYGETDDFAHDGAYDSYLKSGRQTDAFIKDIWEWVQSNDQYRNKTTLIITSDHGRGTIPKDTWRSHGDDIKGADHIWLAAIGPDVKPLGELKSKGVIYQNQIAATVAKLLGLKFENGHEIGAALGF
jgi:hypothetical protein